MEDNTTTDVQTQPEVATAQPAETVVVEAPKAEKPTFKRRKNGRNSRATASQAKASSSQLACGEISDISSETEKLSGSNINGYVSEKKHQKKSEDAQEAQPDQPKSEASEDCKCEKEHNGPSFEQKKFTPRTIEVSLEDRRPKTSDDKKTDGVVSYSSADEANCPSVSVFARIKAALKSIFGSKKSKKSNKNKKFDKNGKKDFRGKKKFHKNFNKDGKNFNRRHQNRGNRRPQGGGNKPQQ